MGRVIGYRICRIAQDRIGENLENICSSLSQAIVHLKATSHPVELSQYGRSSQISMSSVCPLRLILSRPRPSLSLSLFRRADVHHFALTSWVSIHFVTFRASASRLSRYRVKAMNRLSYRVCLQLRCSAVAGNSKYPNITDIRCWASILIPFTVSLLCQLGEH